MLESVADTSLTIYAYKHCDPWIPNAVTRRPITPRGGTIFSGVSDMIDPNLGTWDRELVNDIFWEEDAKHILSIPIRPDMEDTIAWHFDPKGTFSVKSAYHVLEENKQRNQEKQRGESSKAPIQVGVLDWRKIWAVDLMPKVKHFLWRLTTNSLPWRKNIKRRGMQLDTICPVCRRLDEDGGHYFLNCKFVKRCWRIMCLEQVRCYLLLAKTVGPCKATKRGGE